MSDTEPVHERAAPAMPWPGLIALAAAVFLSITNEMLPTGLLPEMGGELAVPEAFIGLTVSVFAFTVVVTSAPLVAATSRIPRRALLVAVLIVLGCSTALSALAVDYWMLVAVRVVGGVAHGVFWALVAASAARLVPERLIGRAVAVVLGGGTLALVAGVPAATVLGQAIGWRAAFGVVAVLTFVCAVVVRLALPADRAGASPTAARYRPSDAGFGQVLLVCVVTAVTMLGQYAVYTYVAPLITDLIGLEAGAIGPLLFVYGIAGAAGLVLAGSPLSRHATGTMIWSMSIAAVALTVLALDLAVGVSIAAFAVWGLAFGAIPPLLQIRLLQAAPAGHRDAASALYTTAFNVGIGGGALVGSVVFGALGVATLPWLYAAVLVVAVAVVAIGSRAPRDRSGRPRRPARSSAPRSG
ncbi:MFS transporter [Agromyces aerolatus]|uniref:MFS transporter n=1 Tax=Agromyces sp. LY-1074 TaxID=3074080 RepID=UPI002857EE46|nr:MULTISPECIES: MFS transporter [unclassified Agromyces]MDR5698277.1 MFS transporter [Agromyces sp. LY-1074]MDR5704571.1 MFS transporter [Agromyces sp. LY-1358]